MPTATNNSTGQSDFTEADYDTTSKGAGRVTGSRPTGQAPAGLDASRFDPARVAYRPSNGTEGADFMWHWCDRCERDRAFREDTGDSCPIAAATMVYSADDLNYPVEWREDGPLGPRCEAFEQEAGQ